MIETRQALSTVIQGRSLGRDQAHALMRQWMSEDVDHTHLGAFLAALETRGHDVDELTGFAQGMRDAARSVAWTNGHAVDTCGTGGDGLRTFNFSTAAALVAAGAGVVVAKHGNRAVSSNVGSADVLEALGIQIDGDECLVKASVEQAGFGFFFAPKFHPAMKYVAPTRKKLGIRTVFNLLGPLANPARVTRQVIGISNAELAEAYAQVLRNLGVKRAMVVYGQDGMDELSPAGISFIIHVFGDGRLKHESVTPEDAGLRRCPLSTLIGRDAPTNARLMEDVLNGVEGPLLEGTLLNTAAAIVVAGEADTLKDGAAIARESVVSGRAAEVLDKLRRINRDGPKD